MSTTNSNSVSARDLIWPVALMFVTVVVASVVLAGLDVDVMGVVGPLLAAFTTLVGIMGTWVAVSRVGDKVDQVAEVTQNAATDTAEIKEQTNGKLHAAIKGIAYDSTIRALRDHLDPDERPDPV